MPYFPEYRKTHSDCSFKEYAEWTKGCTLTDYERPEADPDYDRHNQAMCGCLSYARCPAGNGQIYISVWLKFVKRETE